jgi:hypothetical protein
VTTIDLDHARRVRRQVAPYDADARTVVRELVARAQELAASSDQALLVDRSDLVTLVEDVTAVCAWLLSPRPDRKTTQQQVSR